MQRLSLAELKAKANTSVIENAEIYTGGEDAQCHFGDCIPDQRELRVPYKPWPL
jgi:hypothetical protein